MSASASSSPQLAASRLSRAFSFSLANCLLTIVTLAGLANCTHPVRADDRSDLQVRYAAAEDKLKAGDAAPQVWNEILETLYRLDQPRRALGAARVAAQEFSDHPDVVGHIARAYFRGGFPDHAAKLFDKVETSDPDAALALTLSKLLHSEGRAGPALQVAGSGLSRQPNDPELHYQAGLLHAWLGHNARAAQAFQSALDQAATLEGYPKDLIASRALGRSLIHRAAQDKPVNAVLKTGVISFQLGQGLALPTVAAQVGGGQAVNMLLDLSGGAMLSLDAEYARSAGIQILGQGKILDVTGGSSDTSWALADRLAVGDCALHNVATQVYPFNQDELPDLKGVIGVGLFAKKRVVVDLQQRRVRIEESVSSQSTAPADPLRTPLTIRFLSGDQPLIPVQLKDETVNAIFDIGSPVSCFSTQQMSALQAPTAIRQQRFGDIQASVSTRIPFRIGRRTFAQAQTIALPFIEHQTSSALGVQIDMLLGWDVFKEMRRFTVDTPARKITIDWLPPRKRGPPPAETKQKAGKQ